jgi:zinc transport system permease protein
MDIIAFWENPIMCSALIAGLFAAILGGIVGSIVVVKRISFVSGSISHSILAGMGLFLWLERTFTVALPSPMWGALITAVLAAIAISHAEASFRAREDSIIATVWAAGMAIGIIFISKTPGYTTDLSNILIGNILWVSSSDIFLLAALAATCLIFTARKFQQIKLLTFDKDEAKLQGVHVNKLYTQLLILVAMSVVALTQVVGIVLVMTMLTLPQLLSALFCQKLSSMIVLSIVTSAVCTASGLLIAYFLDWPAGASIAITSMTIYLLGVAFTRFSSRATV